MKSIFQNKYNKNNPFNNKDKKKGENEEAMTQEDKEQEIQQDQEIAAAEEETEAGENAEQSETIEKSDTEKLQEKYDDLNNQYIRLAADFDNYRKRQAQERESLITFGAAECMKKVIEVADNFDRAIEMVEKIDDIAKMKETFHVLNKQLSESLTKLGLEQIKSVGEKFNPNLHEAVMQTPTDEYEEETIINELQKGYKLGDKVLRPAMVSVAVKQ